MRWIHTAGRMTQMTGIRPVWNHRFLSAVDGKLNDLEFCSSMPSLKNTVIVLITERRNAHVMATPFAFPFN
jgi:hypothetical protein